LSTDFYRAPESIEPVPEPRLRRESKLIPLLVLIAIVAGMFVLLQPAYDGARDAAIRISCKNNLKQIALALSAYESEFNALPSAYTIDADGRPLHSWRTLILPYLEQKDLYATINLSKPWDDRANAKAMATPIDVYRCPLSRGPANSTSYLATVADDGCLLPTRPRALADIKDNHYSTLMLIETSDEKSRPWMEPTDADEELLLSLISPKSNFHHRYGRKTGFAPDGANAGFVDGGVHFLKADTKPDVLRAFFSISGGEITEVADY
jgi:type II secretory pathway pseudopilin PulG